MEGGHNKTNAKGKVKAKVDNNKTGGRRLERKKNRNGIKKEI